MSKFVDQKRRSFFRKRQKIHPLPSIIGSVRNSDHAKGAGGVFLHYEIFLDLLFAENLLLNYTILRLSSFLLKRSATRRRSFAAAALGAGMRCCMPCLHGICRVRCSPWSESELQQGW
ncbi:MAG: sigma-E processing peptidase SpoIIGA [Clostridia bacterium]